MKPTATNQTFLNSIYHFLQQDDNLDKLINAHVLVVGLGGVGSFAAEFIVRAGVGNMTILDGDTVDPTNRNRQLPLVPPSVAEFIGRRGLLRDK